ncbi:MAG: hypothetical protein AAF567_19050 [Actinomycetota bacterium]
MSDPTEPGPDDGQGAFDRHADELKRLAEHYRPYFEARDARQNEVNSTRTIGMLLVTFGTILALTDASELGNRAVSVGIFVLGAIATLIGMVLAIYAHRI